MVRNLWNEQQASQFSTPLDQRVYSSRLLGEDKALVIHGGGNTSVKDEILSLLGQKEGVLYVKGSGFDMACIDASGFPALKLSSLLELRKLKELSDAQLENALYTNLFHYPSAQPSVETLLHAFLPQRFIDHTHAKAILTLTNQPDGEKHLKQIFGNRVALVPYRMPGFGLAKLTLETFEKNTEVEGLILLKHGIVTFGDTAKASYDKMIELVALAEEYVQSRKSSSTPIKSNSLPRHSWMQAVRSEYLRHGFPSVLTLNYSEKARQFCSHPKLEAFCGQGPLTPDYAIRTKPKPLLVTGTEETLPQKFDDYISAYTEYFKTNNEGQSLTMLDPYPRVIIIPEVGIISAGKTHQDSTKARDIFSHSTAVMMDAEEMGGYQALPDKDIFDVEYWGPQQAKLKLNPPDLPLSGKIAVVTGGANGIGLGITKEFLDQGAVVCVLDFDSDRFPSVEKELHAHKKSGNTFFLIKTDVSKREEVSKAIQDVVEEFGGLDILVVNAGIFPSSSPIEDISLEHWKRSMSINLDGSFHTIAEGVRWMKAQKAGGDIVIVASKNVPAPGKGAAAYSVSKAAQTQLARVCALEGGSHGIRVNMLHPHLIFDTNIWTEEVLEKRAKAYGMTKEQYISNNLLKTRLCSVDVAKAAFALVGGYFSKTTGAQIAIDGGSDRTL